MLNKQLIKKVMLKPIKYRRFNIIVDSIGLQEFFDKLISDGYEIIYYDETQIFDDGENKLKVTVVGCKKQNDTIN